MGGNERGDMALGDRLRAARAEQREMAQAERGDVQAALHALRASGIRPGSNEERRERWLKLRLSRIDDALASEL